MSQAVAGLLPEFGHLHWIGILPSAALRVQIGLHEVLRAQGDVLDGLLRFCGQCPQHGAVEHHAWPRGPRDAHQIACLPSAPQQPGQQGMPLLFQFAGLLGGGANDTGVGLAAPPLLFRRGQLQGPLPRVKLVDIRNNDIANRLLRAADAAQVGDVGGKIR